MTRATTAQALLALALVGFSPAARAGTEGSIARAVSVQGTVEVQRVSASAWTAVKVNDAFAAGDTIRVQPRSRADVALLDTSVLRLNENTTMKLQPPKQRTGVIDLLRGATHFLSRGPGTLDVRTAAMVAGVRGTEFLVEAGDDVTSVTVFEGTVSAENPEGKLTLGPGQSATARPGSPPTLRVVARPRDAVQWALHYPPVIHFRPDEVAEGPWKPHLRRSHEAYSRGELDVALTALDEGPQDASVAAGATYRAQLLLTVGRADQAAAALEKRLTAAPDDADALSLLAIIHIAQNDRERALDAARRAVAAAPTSATAQLAMSYAQQSRFDLPGARLSVERAVKLEPNNALAWARLAELRASFGELNASFAAATTAASLDPNLSRTQAVLGFAHLARVDVAAARLAFEKAVLLDSADPLPRLGLGLAKIRSGDLRDGARDVEAAASLAPNDALIRAYLGKTYFEEKRSGLDEREHEMAEQLDPNDPTPLFYSAISKQTRNRPVEALQDLEKAIERNDNRAVFRSRLLLDSDLAARSASLARIYSDLGFQQLALVEGWKAVNTDPTSFSAHRFLADSYSVLPRHEIARVSELLQAQLLQPANVNPLQPSVGESNLFLASSAGAGGLSFNEFSAVFDRDRVASQLSGFGGSKGTFGSEAVVAGIRGPASVSAGYSRFQTDGFRDNADQKDDVANAFVQYEVSPATSVQAEYRYRKHARGDLRQDFFSEVFFAGMRDTVENHTARVGARHALSPSAVLLGSFTFQDSTGKTRIDEFAGPDSALNISTPARALGSEAQYLWRIRRVNLRAGGGYFDIQSKLDMTTRFPGFEPGAPADVMTTTLDANGHHLNAYSYADVRLPLAFTGTVGGSFDSVSGEQRRDQFNPKLGLTWTPIPGTTLRAAAFRTLKRTLVTNQTLEPTEVAGFNQFYDDANVTRSWRYGAAVDQKVLANLFAGAELSKRDLVVPFTDLEGNEASTDWSERQVRGYLFYAPHRWFALSAEYSRERFNRGSDFGAGIADLDTHRVPLAIRFFHPSGLGAGVAGTYWDQSGKFESFDGPVGGSDAFWIFDAMVSYRLPRRLGMVAVGATNLFDKQFNYFETDTNNVRLQPLRRVFTKLAVALP